jgi:hypothetical protein
MPSLWEEAGLDVAKTPILLRLATTWICPPKLKRHRSFLRKEAGPPNQLGAAVAPWWKTQRKVLHHSPSPRY